MIRVSLLVSAQSMAVRSSSESRFRQQAKEKGWPQVCTTDMDTARAGRCVWNLPTPPAPGARTRPPSICTAMATCGVGGGAGGVPSLLSPRIWRPWAEGRPQEAAATVLQARALRDDFYTSTAHADGRAPAAEDLALLNGALVEALPHRRLVYTGVGFTWQWEEDPAALVEPLWRLRPAADLLTSPDLLCARMRRGDVRLAVY